MSEETHHQIILLEGMSSKQEVSQSAYIPKELNYSITALQLYIFLLWKV